MQLISETKVLKKTPSFQDMDYLILETAVRTLANRFCNDFLLKEENFNKAMQFAAYQQFTLWQCGFMGQTGGSQFHRVVWEEFRESFLVH